MTHDVYRRVEGVEYQSMTSQIQTEISAGAARSASFKFTCLRTPSGKRLNFFRFYLTSFALDEEICYRNCRSLIGLQVENSKVGED